MLNYRETQIHNEIKTCEQKIFDIRRERLKYFTIAGEKVIADGRYSDAIQKAAKDEKDLMLRIAVCEGALYSASEIAGKVNPAARSAPYTWLLDRTKVLKKAIGEINVEIQLLKQQIDANQGVSGVNRVDRHGKVHASADTNSSWAQRIKGYEDQLKELEPELVKTEKAYRDVEKVLQSAGA